MIHASELARRIRLHALNMTHSGNSSHIGSVLSMADILSVLYSSILSYDPSNPSWTDRDRFILSKGHAGAGVYAVLAECGFFPISKLSSHYQNGSQLSGHVSHKGNPGVEVSTGSLGHGLPIAVGMAKAAKIQKKDHSVYCLMSDGECDEGSNWEAALFASHHNLDNLIVIIDYNKLQSIRPCSETLALEPFLSKWASFNWKVCEVDGNCHESLLNAFLDCKNSSGSPKCIIAHTTKGKGVSFMENSILWHYRSPQGSEYESAHLQLSQR